VVDERVKDDVKDSAAERTARLADWDAAHGSGGAPGAAHRRLLTDADALASGTGVSASEHLDLRLVGAEDSVRKALRMPILKRKTPEEIQAERLEDQRRRAAADASAHQMRIQKARDAFFASPAGRARKAFANGDLVFQYSLDVLSQQAIIIAMHGGYTTKKQVDPTDVINAVCREGWDLVNGSFVFLEQGQESRDKFMSSGQNVAVKGTVVGYYLFRRGESNRVEPLPKPWEDVA